MNFDDELRSRLQADTSPGSQEAMAVLHELEPRMRRARAARHVGSVAATATVVMFVGLGAVALRMGPTEQTLQSPSETLPGTDTRTDERGIPPATDARHAERDDTVVVSAPPEVDTTAVSASGPLETDSRREDPVVPAPSGSTAPATTAPRTTTATTAAPAITTATTAAPAITAAAPATTTATTATTAAPIALPPPTSGDQRDGEHSIVTSCGSIVVERVGHTVTLISTSPNDGMRVDVKKDGPGEVEVRFAGDQDECEIKVKVHDGELQIDVDNR